MYVCADANIHKKCSFKVVRIKIIIVYMPAGMCVCARVGAIGGACLRARDFCTPLVLLTTSKNLDFALLNENQICLMTSAVS